MMPLATRDLNIIQHAHAGVDAASIKATSMAAAEAPKAHSLMDILAAVELVESLESGSQAKGGPAPMEQDCPPLQQLRSAEEDTEAAEETDHKLMLVLAEDQPMQRSSRRSVGSSGGAGEWQSKENQLLLEAFAAAAAMVQQQQPLTGMCPTSGAKRSRGPLDASQQQTLGSGAAMVALPVAAHRSSSCPITAASTPAGLPPLSSLTPAASAAGDAVGAPVQLPADGAAPCAKRARASPEPEGPSAAAASPQVAAAPAAPILSMRRASSSGAHAMQAQQQAAQMPQTVQQGCQLASAASCPASLPEEQGRGGRARRAAAANASGRWRAALACVEGVQEPAPAQPVAQATRAASPPAPAPQQQQQTSQQQQDQEQQARTEHPPMKRNTLHMAQAPAAAAAAAAAAGPVAAPSAPQVPSSEQQQQQQQQAAMAAQKTMAPYSREQLQAWLAGSATMTQREEAALKRAKREIRFAVHRIDVSNLEQLTAILREATLAGIPLQLHSCLMPLLPRAQAALRVQAYQGHGAAATLGAAGVPSTAAGAAPAGYYALPQGYNMSQVTQLMQAAQQQQQQQQQQAPASVAAQAQPAAAMQVPSSVASLPAFKPIVLPSFPRAASAPAGTLPQAPGNAAAVPTAPVPPAAGPAPAASTVAEAFKQGAAWKQQEATLAAAVSDFQQLLSSVQQPLPLLAQAQGAAAAAQAAADQRNNAAAAAPAEAAAAAPAAAPVAVAAPAAPAVAAPAQAPAAVAAPAVQIVRTTRSRAAAAAAAAATTATVVGPYDTVAQLRINMPAAAKGAAAQTVAVAKAAA